VGTSVPIVTSTRPVRVAARALVGLPASWPMHFGYTDLQSKTPAPKDWRKCLILLVGPAGFEPATKGL